MAKETKKEKKDLKNKKHFFKDFKAELKKVIWPTPKQLVNNTIAVAVIVVVTTAIVFVLDLCFDMLNTYGINKIKANIKNSVAVEEVVDGNEVAENNVVEDANQVDGTNEVETTNQVNEEE